MLIVPALARAVLPVLVLRVLRQACAVDRVEHPDQAERHGLVCKAVRNGRIPVDRLRDRRRGHLGCADHPGDLGAGRGGVRLPRLRQPGLARWVEPGEDRPAADATRFEEWKFPYANVLGYAAAVRYALRGGLEPISLRAPGLATRFCDRLAVIPGVRVLDDVS
ncbi:hypothetical protein [Amycolatopsis plumensis]|uniref:Uncharacterized protein n=1 Tax=Amycolatopsis plumensis TaxID=236508 RepID=A0ABV5UID4_9PSEU